jgi:hypothetical protein
MNYKSDNAKALMQPVIDSIGEWTNENLVKIEMRPSIDFPVLLNLSQVTEKCGEKTIPKPRIPVFVIPCCRLRNILQNCGQNP